MGASILLSLLELQQRKLGVSKQAKLSGLPVSVWRNNDLHLIYSEWCSNADD